MQEWWIMNNTQSIPSAAAHDANLTVRCIYLLWKYRWFTMSYQLLLFSKVIWFIHTHICIYSVYIYLIYVLRVCVCIYIYRVCVCVCVCIHMFFSIKVYYRILNIVPCAIQKDLDLFIYFIYSTLYPLIPNS